MTEAWTDQCLAQRDVFERRLEWIDEQRAKLALLDLDSFMDMNKNAFEIEAKRGFTRWHSGEDGDEESIWFCSECLSEAEPDEGCPICSEEEPDPDGFDW
jgi:rubrerythrin